MNNRITIKVATHGTRLINRLIMEGIEFYDVKTTPNHIFISINKDDKASTIDILTKLKLVYKIVKNTSFYNLSHAFIGRIGIVTGVILLFVMIILTKFMTLDIEINGNNRISDRVILDSLSSLDIRPNTIRVKDTQKLASSLLSMHSEMASCTCYYEGGKLVVDIEEEMKEPLYKKDVDGNIIANFDGIVTRVILESGTLRVKVGDTVRCGDILIEPYVRYGEGEEERIRETIARGKVYARCYLEENIVLGEKNIIEVETGKTKIVNRYWGKPKVPYKNCQVSSKKRRLYSLMPIEYTVYNYNEIAFRNVGIDNKEYVNTRINNAYKRLDMRVFEGEKVLDKWIFQKRLDNTYIISVYYEVEKLISGGKLE